MVESKTKTTHTAYAFRREGKKAKFGRWLEVGSGRNDDNGVVHVFLDRLPIGGFSGYVYLMPIGAKLPSEPKPERPGSEDDDEEQSES